MINNTTPSRSTVARDSTSRSTVARHSTSIAVQLYSLRHLSDSFTEIAAAAVQAGYKGVELIVLADHTGEETKAILDGHGLQVVSAHVPYQALIQDFAGTVAFQRAVGNDCLVLPGPAPEMRQAANAEAWRSFGQTLNELGIRCRAEGMRLGYHNHAFEMAEYDGARAIDWLLMSAEPENLFWEPDLAWVAHGGASPLELVQSYAGRCPRIHAKDLAPAGENEDQMGLADVGYGTLDWDALLPACRAAGAECYIVEHDLPKDPVASVCRSRKFLESRKELLSDHSAEGREKR